MPGVVLGILHLLTHLICENTLPILDKEANVCSTPCVTLQVNWQRQDLNSCLPGSKAYFKHYLINNYFQPLIQTLRHLTAHPIPTPVFPSSLIPMSFPSPHPTAHPFL